MTHDREWEAMPIRSVMTVNIGCAKGDIRPRLMKVAVKRSRPRHSGLGQVLDVLGEGETRRDDPGIHHPIDETVELTTQEPPDAEDENPLGGLLDEGRDEHRGREHRDRSH